MYQKWPSVPKKKMKYLKSLTQMHHQNHDEPSTITLN